MLTNEKKNKYFIKKLYFLFVLIAILSLQRICLWASFHKPGEK